MLYYLYLLQDWFSPLRVFKYITVRSVAAAGTAFLLCLIFGTPVIEWLRRMKTTQREDKEQGLPFYELHKGRKNVPSMGGVLIVGSLTVAVLLWAMPTNPYVWLVLATTLYMALVGFWDDYTKLVSAKSRGMCARTKFGLQLLWAVAIAVVLLVWPETRQEIRQLMVPFVKDPVVRDLGTVGVIVFVALIITGATNAVNLTDGLDGLAIGCTSSAALSYLIMSYVAGHVAFAQYLFIPYIRHGGELAVFCGALLGASLGFLWHNCFPARVFMGDTGSLALGGAIAMVAILIQQPVVLILVGGVFVMEAGSVILQVTSFKLTGRRIFLCTPLHHHFEMKKWSETQVVVRFWILSIIFALLGAMALKIR